MVPFSLVSRLFAAGRRTNLQPPKALPRFFHGTSSLRSPARSPKGDLTASVAAGEPPEADPTTSELSLARAVEDAVDDLLKAAESRKTRTKKNIPQVAAEDEVPVRKAGRPRKKTLPAAAENEAPVRKAGRPRKKALPGAASPSDLISTTSISADPSVLQRPRRPARKPKTDPGGEPAPSVKQKKKDHGPPPPNPRSNIKSYLEWGYGQRNEDSSLFAIAHRRRMHIISEDACDSILARMKPSLERHMGCDILDINPGVGVWSAKLHDFLKPRKHILLEPDINMYGPLLEPLVAAPNSTYTLIPKSGINWGHLEEVLSEAHLPFQTAWPRSNSRVEERNDTLLVTANIGYNPKKTYKGFSSLAQMVIYQFMGAAKAHSLFQKYGLVRMLIWINDEERYNVLPRSLFGRSKASVETSLACEKVEEIASGTEWVGARTRELDLDLESGLRVLKRMAENGIEIPKGRESLLAKKLQGGDVEIKAHPSRFDAIRVNAEIAAIKKAQSSGETVSFRRLRSLEDSQRREVKRNALVPVCDMYEAMVEEAKVIHGLPDSAAKDAKYADLKERLDVWDESVDNLGRQLATMIRYNCENRLGLRRKEPLLLWDRREVEPIRLAPEEFYPANAMSLIDFQPKTLAPVLRDNFPANYDILEYLLLSFYISPAQSVEHALRSLLPGAYEWIIAECPSLRDPRKGGNPRLKFLTVRMLSDEMLLEMVEAWVRWPFKPSQSELLSRMGSSTFDADAPPELED